MSTELTNTDRLTALQLEYSDLLPRYSFGDFLVGYRPDPSSQLLTRSVPSGVVGDAYPADEGGARIFRPGDGNSVLVPASGTPVVLDVLRRPELMPVNNPSNPQPGAQPGAAGASASGTASVSSGTMRAAEIVALVVVGYIGYRVFLAKR
jgi:hypothetical protein